MQDLIGIFIPIIIDFINQHISSAQVRYWISLIICISIGIAVNIDKLNTPGDFLVHVALVVATAQATYKKFWEDSTARKVAFPKTQYLGK